jgi:predicted flap endonuclease-1-like 5' DNA nuclease
MTLVEKLKSVLGLGSSSDPRESVPVEREQTDTGSERAVKESAGDAPEEPAPEESTETTTADETTADQTTADETAADDDDDSAADASAGQSVESIKGIGPAYADRLAAMDIETVQELAAAEPDAVAEETGISIGRVSNWIERARNRGS